jgi:ZIP family zinc transporter
MSEPLGALLAYLFLAPFINDIVLGILFAIIAGIMIQIAFFELIVQSRSYHEKALFNLFFILGIIFMLLKFIF